MSMRKQTEIYVRKVGEECTVTADGSTFHCFIQPNKQATKPSIIQNMYFGYIGYDSEIEPGDIFTDANGQHWLCQIRNPWYLKGILCGYHLTLLKVNSILHILSYETASKIMGGIDPTLNYTENTTAVYATIIEKGEALLHRPEADLASYDFIVYMPDSMAVVEQNYAIAKRYAGSGLNETIIKIETINRIDCPGIWILEANKVRD